MTRHLEIARPDPDLMNRMLEFELALESSVAETVEPVEGGVAVLNPSVPLVWDDSFLVLDRNGRTARELAALADEVIPQEVAGRTIVMRDPGEALPLEPGFASLGWKADRGVWMAHRADPDRPSDAEVREAGADEVAGLRRETFLDNWAEDYGGAPELVADQWLSRQEALCGVASARWLCADLDGAPASCCALLSADGVGQIEWVGTSPRARNRGLARSVILAAVEESRAQGNALTMIGADLDNRAWQLYARLGFEPVGTDIAFLCPRREPS